MPKPAFRDFLLKQIKSPVKVALLLGLLVVLLMPPLVPKHKIQLDNNFSAPNRMYAYYPDTTGKITDMSFLRTSITSIMLESYEERLYVIDGFSYQDYQDLYCPLPAPRRDWVFIEDITGDKFQEVFYVSQENDSVKFYVSSTKSLKTESVKCLPIKGKLLYYYLRYYRFEGNDLVYFSIGSKLGKGKFETILFSYDYKKDVIKTVYKSSMLQNGEQFTGKKNCILFSGKIKQKSVLTNVNVETGFADSFTVEVPEVRRVRGNLSVETYPYQYASDGFLYHNGDSLLYGDVEALLLNNEFSGELIDDGIFLDKNLPQWRNYHLQYFKGKTVFYTLGPKNKTELYKYDIEKSKLTRVRIKGNPQVVTILYYGDVDGNGKNDIVYTDKDGDNNAYCIYEEGSYSDLCRYNVDRERMDVKNCALENDSILFQSKGIEFVMIYGRNPDYYKHWLWCAAIFFVVMLIGFLLQKIKENRELRRKETNSKIMQLQLENVQKRIDPHFIFNSLNNLGSLILEGESNASYDYLSRVSGVLYKALRNRSVLVAIDEELKFCTSVLDTQRQRFGDKFDYEVYVDKGIDLTRKMPSNILNSMVDNCIKHGFAGINYKGMINIEFVKKDKGFAVVVEDNGKGRAAAQADKDQTKSTGTGLEICYQYVELLNFDRKENLLSFSIEDLYHPDKSPKGTRCKFYVPDDLKQES